ncbi:MAG: hypothetical protein SGPRY_001436 [Prymnesium sp.]
MKLPSISFGVPLLERVALLASRLVALIIVPAQLPGDVIDLMESLNEDAPNTIKSWCSADVRRILRQLLTSQKLTIPQDPQLERLAALRSRFTTRGWSTCKVHTSDRVQLDAMLFAPSTHAHAADSTQFSHHDCPRYILFVGGNFQKYEDWLPYFELYAKEVGTGFMCFNFRGVARSHGAVCCADDLITDVRACVDFLLEHGVLPQHILLHGFSLGGAVAALFLAQERSPPCALTSDRSFRSLSRAAFAIIRGANLALGMESTSSPDTQSAGGQDMSNKRANRSLVSRMLPFFVCWIRGIGGWIACSALRALGWDLNAEAAFARIPGRKILLFHRLDNVIQYKSASLHVCLENTSQTECASAVVSSNLEVIEVQRMGANGWPTHDFPLCADKEAWQQLLQAERCALGLEERAPNDPIETGTDSFPIELGLSDGGDDDRSESNDEGGSPPLAP